MANQSANKGKKILRGTVWTTLTQRSQQITTDIRLQDARAKNGNLTQNQCQ